MAQAGKPTIRINDKEFMKLLREHGAEPTRRVGEATADAIRRKVPDDVPVGVIHKLDRNGRPVALVTIAHPSGLARQAKDGVVTRSVAEQGIDITRYPGVG